MKAISYYPRFDHQVKDIEIAYEAGDKKMFESRLEFASIVRCLRNGIWYDVEVRDMYIVGRDEKIEYALMTNLQRFLSYCEMTYLWWVNPTPFVGSDGTRMLPSPCQESRQIMLLKSDLTMGSVDFRNELDLVNKDILARKEYDYR